ncbi:MAG: metallophosphoesterase [Janthinobacterium lividum]
MRFFVLFCLLIAAPWLAAGVHASAQNTAPVLLLSDIHFDPFHNPRDLAQLRSAPIEQWPAILNASTSLGADVDRLAVDAKCGARTSDTGWPLLQTTLHAAHGAEAHPVFVTLSGDLLAHQFPCRFHHIATGASDADLSAFSAKTVAFVTLQLRLAFPHVPVYVALGNNDSGCADYDETPGNAFAESTTATMLAAAAQANGASSDRLLVNTSPEGDYSVALPTPFQHGRLLVLNDVYDSEYFLICGGGAEPGPEASQIAWLRAQLTAARAHHEQVWVMGHIPPGIDVYASFHRFVLRPSELCSANLQPFLKDSHLADTLLDYADIIRLALFAHTHMDEIRSLHRPGTPSANAGSGQAAAAIPIKMVPSVTPYFGNHPAFLLAAVDPHTLVLKDWQTMVSPSSDGSAPPWTLGYQFSTAFHLPDFSAASAMQLADGFALDRDGKAARSATYRAHFFAGDMGLYAFGLDQIWPAYGCAVREHGAEAFHDCLCPATAPPTNSGK